MRILTSILLIAAAPAMAQAPVRLHGTVLDVAGDHVHVQAEDGPVDVLVPAGVRIVELVQGDRSLLVPGAHVTIRGTAGPGGAVTAVAIQAEKNGVQPLP
ncbi:MAG TPA: hypothetical protein VE650_15080 [Acetobacteraceae bacterium]|nr:hypothetical protein [Acetobacteraceae bacterium]